MATVIEMNKKVIDLKLDFLTEQRDLVLKSLGDYIDKVIAEGRVWIDNKSQNQSTFSQVSQMIDSAVNFLNLKYHDMEGMIQFEPMQELLQEAQPDSTQWTPSYIPLSGSPTSSVLISSAGESLLQPVYTRCDLMMQSIDKLHTSTEMLKDAQADFTKQCADISVKQFELDKAMSDVISQKTMFEDTQSSQLNENKQQVHKVIVEQNHMIKQQDVKIRSLERQLETLSSKINELEQLYSSKSGVSNEVKGSMDMINVHLEIIKNHTDSLSSTVDDTSLTVWQLSNKTEAVEELANSLSQQVSSNKQALQVISTKQELFGETVKKLEHSLEAINRQDLEDLEKRVQEANDSYKMLCVILSKRLQPLEQLRDCLNKKVQARDEHVKKLLHVIADVEALTTQVADLADEKALDVQDV
ncbi:hypothetical protein BsWGS_16640 [Bradybaena similaris]